MDVKIVFTFFIIFFIKTRFLTFLFFQRFYFLVAIFLILLNLLSSHIERLLSYFPFYLSQILLTFFSHRPFFRTSAPKYYTDQSYFLLFKHFIPLMYTCCFLVSAS